MDSLKYLSFVDKKFNATLNDKKLGDEYVRKYQPSFMLTPEDEEVINQFRNKNHGIKDKSKS